MANVNSNSGLTVKPTLITNTRCLHKNFSDTSIAHNIFKTHDLFFFKGIAVRSNYLEGLNSQSVWSLKHSGRFLHAPMMVFPVGSAGKESACNVGDLGSLIPGLRRSHGEGKGYPLQYSDQENPMDCTVPGVGESDTTEPLSVSWWYWIGKQISQVPLFLWLTWSVRWGLHLLSHKMRKGHLPSRPGDYAHNFCSHSIDQKLIMGCSWPQGRLGRGVILVPSESCSGYVDDALYFHGIEET